MFPVCYISFFGKSVQIYKMAAHFHSVSSSSSDDESHNSPYKGYLTRPVEQIRLNNDNKTTVKQNAVVAAGVVDAKSG